jgi:hypothetical protein
MRTSLFTSPGQSLIALFFVPLLSIRSRPDSDGNQSHIYVSNSLTGDPDLKQRIFSATDEIHAAVSEASSRERLGEKQIKLETSSSHSLDGIPGTQKKVEGSNLQAEKATAEAMLEANVKIAALTSELAAEKQKTARVEVEKAALELKLYEHARLRELIDLLECVISCTM